MAPEPLSASRCGLQGLSRRHGRPRPRRSRGRAGRVPEPARSVGLRQDNLPPGRRRLRGAERRARAARRRDITALRPYDRPVNTVFQDYALFPHMNVAENVGFGSVAAHASAQTRSAARSPAPSTWSGLADKIETARLGALRRTAATRGSWRGPSSASRACCCSTSRCRRSTHILREQMQVELKRLQARLGTTFIMVTHDQTEALSISDRVAVMNRGRIEQIATPPVLYDAPATRFVATLHRHDERAREPGDRLEKAGQAASRRRSARLRRARRMVPSRRPGGGEPIAVCIRPEDILIEPAALRPMPRRPASSRRSFTGRTFARSRRARRRNGAHDRRATPRR